MLIKKLTFHSHGDDHRDLVALEELKDIPFSIKRVYYVYNTEAGATTGCHAHRTLQQVLICIHGSCKVKLDNGKETETITLNKPNEGLYVPKATWREITEFSPDAVILVVASEFYDETDYIRDYNEFLRFVSEQGDKNT